MEVFKQIWHFKNIYNHHGRNLAYESILVIEALCPRHSFVLPGVWPNETVFLDSYWPWPLFQSGVICLQQKVGPGLKLTQQVEFIVKVFALHSPRSGCWARTLICRRTHLPPETQGVSSRLCEPAAWWAHGFPSLACSAFRKSVGWTMWVQSCLLHLYLQLAPSFKYLKEIYLIILNYVSLFVSVSSEDKCPLRLEGSDFPELRLRAVVRCPTWVPGAKQRSSPRAISALSH